MAVKLDGMSHKDLQSLIAQAQSKIESARADLIGDVRRKIDALLHAEGLQLSDVYPGKAGKAGKRGSGASVLARVFRSTAIRRTRRRPGPVLARSRPGLLRPPASRASLRIHC